MSGLHWWSLLKLTVICGLIILVSAPEWMGFQDEAYLLQRILGQKQFDFLVWELQALYAKGETSLTFGQAYVDEENRRQIVFDYLALLAQSNQLESEIASIYADPANSDPATASANLQAQFDDLRQELASLQPTAEAILEEQVATILVEEGVGYGGQPFPPVRMQITPLPSILIVSPRDHIEQIHNIPLTPSLFVPAQDAIETEVYQKLDRSALIVPIGGLGIYPAMVLESSNLTWLLDTIAHEWTHHWLTLHPLGIRYNTNSAMRTINETVASIAGTEIGAKAIARYYPELMPPPPSEQNTDTTPPDIDNNAPPPFNFRAEMAQTRIQVDTLLAEGKVEEAEAYMENRRQLFLANGYRIRKLNQAYFAFYGAYADQPGATGSDPIGPALTQLREQSPSFYDFLQQAGDITSMEELTRLAEINNQN